MRKNKKLGCQPVQDGGNIRFNVEDLSVCESDDEEDVKRLEQHRRDAEKVADAVMGPASEREAKAAVSR